MFIPGFRKFWLVMAGSFVCLALYAHIIRAQARGGTPQTDKVQPVNSGANPYRVIRDWAQIEGRAVGRLQRRCHRSRRQDRVGDGSMFAGHDAGLSRYQGEPGPPFR